MKYVFWMLLPIDSVDSLANLMSKDYKGTFDFQGIGFEAGSRQGDRIVSGAGEEYDHCGRWVDSDRNQAEWTKSLEFNNAYINLATFINRVPDDVAATLANGFNAEFGKAGHVLEKVGEHWMIDGVWPPVDDEELAKETYHYSVHGSIPQDNTGF